MKVVLVGAPGTGKNELLCELVKRYKLSPWRSPNALLDQVVGQLADYRTELRLAISRAQNPTHDLYDHSLIDSVAYTSTRYMNMLNNGTVSDEELFRWMMTFHMAALLLRDSFKADKVVFIPGNDGESFSKQIEEALLETLKQLKIEYDTLTEDYDWGAVFSGPNA